MQTEQEVGSYCTEEKTFLRQSRGCLGQQEDGRWGLGGTGHWAFQTPPSTGFPPPSNLPQRTSSRPPLTLSGSLHTPWTAVGIGRNRPIQQSALASSLGQAPDTLVPGQHCPPCRSSGTDVCLRETGKGASSQAAAGTLGGGHVCYLPGLSAPPCSHSLCDADLRLPLRPGTWMSLEATFRKDLFVANVQSFAGPEEQEAPDPAAGERLIKLGEACLPLSPLRSGTASP